MTTRRLSARKARQLIEAAELVKAPDWSETRRWHVVADGDVLVVVEPSYGGTGGWTCHLADLGPSGRRDRHPTREKAAAAGLAAWQRWATAAR